MIPCLQECRNRNRLSIWTSLPAYHIFKLPCHTHYLIRSIQFLILNLIKRKDRGSHFYPIFRIFAGNIRIVYEERMEKVIVTVHTLFYIKQLRYASKQKRLIKVQDH